MGHQTPNISVRRGGGGHLEIEGVDAVGEPVEQPETVITTTAGVGREHEGAELSEAAPGPEGGAERQELIEGGGGRSILNRGGDPDEPQAVFDEHAQVTGGGIRNPDGWEAVVLKKVEEVAGVAAIGLRLAHDHGPDCGGFADDQGMAQSLQERV